MSEFYNKWSVASVFNCWGIARYEDAYNFIHEGRSYTTQSTYIVSNVALCIRNLGYEVKLGVSVITGNNYIVDIYKKNSQGEYVYYYGYWDRLRYRYERPLSGYKTIYQKVNVIECGLDHQKNLWDITTSFLSDRESVDNLYWLIDKGAVNNKYDEEYTRGISTIGNTLPNDIVEALRDFRSDDHNFITEPDYEFYIPESMKEIKACPVAEYQPIEETLDPIEKLACFPTSDQEVNSVSSSDESESDEE